MHRTPPALQMDGLSRGRELVFVLAASNLPWELDQALLRRLEKRILVPLPDQAARHQMLSTLLQVGWSCLPDALATCLPAASPCTRPAAYLCQLPVPAHAQQLTSAALVWRWAPPQGCDSKPCLSKWHQSAKLPCREAASASPLQN
jgi:hypothetical protein